MDKQFTEQDSLRLINEMIDRAKNNFQRGSLTVVLFWGYLVAATSIANFVLLHVLDNPRQSFNVWWVMLLGWIVSYVIQRKIDHTAIVKTHIDAIVKFIWLGFGISVTVLLIVFYTFRLPNNMQFIYITPLIMLMCGMAQLATAKVCRYKSYYWGAVVFWVGAILCSVVTELLARNDYQFLILAAGMIIGFIIPNHILNKKQTDNV